MSCPRHKSVFVFVRVGVGVLLGGLELLAPFNRESHSKSLTEIEFHDVVGRDASQDPQDSKQRAEPLYPSKPQDRKLAGGESHLYEIQLTAGQFLRLVSDQRGIDVALTVFEPNGTKLAEVNLRSGERGFEIASLIANQTGDYRIEVRSVRKTDPPGSYQVKVDVTDSASERDRSVNTAERLLLEAISLEAQATKESRSEAMTKYQESLLLADRVGDLQLKAVVLNRIGRSYFSSGVYLKAIDHHQQALLLARSVSDHQLEAATLTYVGDGYRLTTEYEKAVDYLNQALQGWQLIQDRRGEWSTLNIIARVYFQMGDQYRSLSSFDQALKLSRLLSDKGAEVETLGGMGLSYYVLGENETAAATWKQELALVRAGIQTSREANILTMLGAVHNALGESRQALDYLDQAIKLARDQGDRVREAGVLQTIGRVYRSLGEPKKSIEYLDQSLVLLKEVNNPPTSVARAHYNLGKAYTDLGDYEKALNYLNEALVVWRSRRDSVNIASTIRELARAERGRGNLETALVQSDAALNLIETLRTSAGGSEARATYLASVQDYFELKIDVLTRLHKLHPTKDYAAQALQTSERARARSLLEALAEAGVDIRKGVDPELLKRQQKIAEELSAKASEQAHLVGAKLAQASLIQVNTEIKELSAQHERVEADIRAASPLYAQLKQPQPLSLTEIRQQVVDGQTLLLEYHLGVERSYLWSVTSNSIESYELPKREVIEAAARRVYESLTARNRRVKFETVEERRSRIAKADVNYTEAAQALSRMVLGPVAAQLPDKRLLVVSDGALQYVPFAALPKPGSSSFEPITVTNEVVSLPSASTLAVLRRQVAKRPTGSKTIAVIADPVFDESDQRVRDSLARNGGFATEKVVASRRANVSKSEIQRFAAESGWDSESLSMVRLPFTRREADAIAALVPLASRKLDLDFAANLSNATSSDLSQYRIVHFATHGFLNSRHPELSGLVLSLVDEKGRERNGFLRAHEIYDLKISAELVVLSGCRTGLGKEIRGEGLIGITRAFMHAGSERVMVSLWDVHDEATAELMTRFYTRLLGSEKVSPAAALRAAQVSMARDKRWSSPYFWAGFTLQGEPR